MPAEAEALLGDLNDLHAQQDAAAARGLSALADSIFRQASDLAIYIIENYGDALQAAAIAQIAEEGWN